MNKSKKNKVKVFKLTEPELDMLLKDAILNYKEMRDANEAHDREMEEAFKSVAPVHPPVVISSPSIVKEKWAAITSLVRTVDKLADAISSANIQATVANCNINTGVNGTGVAIGIELPPRQTSTCCGGHP